MLCKPLVGGSSPSAGIKITRMCPKAHSCRFNGLGVLFWIARAKEPLVCGTFLQRLLRLRAGRRRSSAQAQPRPPSFGAPARRPWRRPPSADGVGLESLARQLRWVVQVATVEDHRGGDQSGLALLRLYRSTSPGSPCGDPRRAKNSCVHRNDIVRRLIAR